MADDEQPTWGKLGPLTIQPPVRGEITVSYPNDHAVVVVFTGTGKALALADDTDPMALSSLATVERAVVATRLRSWASLLEKDDLS